jgi:hypothetical protein
VVISQFFHFQFPRILRFKVASPPHPALRATFSPMGEKREVAVLSTANSHARKIRRGFAGSVYLAGALESADD